MIRLISVLDQAKCHSTNVALFLAPIVGVNRGAGTVRITTNVCSNRIHIDTETNFILTM